MQQQINKKVHPGQKLCKFNSQSLGYGLYLKQNSIYASIFGIVKSQKINLQTRYSVINSLPNKRVGLTVGDIVYGRVVKVKQEQFNSIACVERQGAGKAENRGLEGSIRKENVRQKMVDSVIMIQSFRPRDIVKAKVISLGDSLRGIYLSTASENLGVLVAENEETGRLMLPFDWNTMVDPQQLIKQSRKVCKPE